MSSYSLKDHLGMCSLKDLKDLVRKFNLHNKIKLGQKKDALISDLLKHFEAELSADGMLKQSPAHFEMPKMDDVKPKKERAKKVKVEVKIEKIEEKPVEVVVVEVKKEEPKKVKVKKIIDKVVEKMVEPIKKTVKSEKEMYALIDDKLKGFSDLSADRQVAVADDLKREVAEYERAGEKLYKRNPAKFADDKVWFSVPKRGGKK